MSSTTPPIHTDREQPDLRLPDHRQELRSTRGPRHVIGATAGAVGVSLVAVIYLLGAPIIALATGAWQIAMDIRDNAVRPRQFLGARHGFPFLDPPPPPAAVPTDEGDD